MTNISWVINPDGTKGEVWNWWTGCTKFSEGCDHCYAETMACSRLKGRCGYPEDDPFRPTYHADKIDLPTKWKKPRTIFSCSMSDWMHPNNTFRQIDAFLKIVSECRRHIILTLTKRTHNLFSLPDTCLPLNLYLGATIELQKYIHRLEELLSIPAAGHFLSLEPVLGPITIPPDLLKRLAVVIVGGENGTGARPMDPDWVRSLRVQCSLAGVMFFFKGWGKHIPPGHECMPEMLDGVIRRQLPWIGKEVRR